LELFSLEEKVARLPSGLFVLWLQFQRAVYHPDFLSSGFFAIRIKEHSESF
jgi:hypothetical protein